MTTAEALKYVREYYDISNPSEDDNFIFTEALHYLIEETKVPKYMSELAWFYCEQKRFDLEIRYLEMAAEYGYAPAMEELGYMWYYGQHGEKDYEKAFYYFSKGAESGSMWSEYKLADMYKYGCYVEKDEELYNKLIRAAYEKIKTPYRLNDPYPEITYRMAKILAEDGKNIDAAIMLRSAKRFMAERLSYDAFWGHIEVMERIIRLMYSLTDVNMNKLDVYDIFGVILPNTRYTFKIGKKKYKIETDNEVAIKFEGTWYRDYKDFIQKATIGNEKITKIYDELYGWEVLK